MVLTPMNSKLKNLVVAEAVKHGGEFIGSTYIISSHISSSLSYHFIVSHLISLSSTHSLNDYQPDGGCEWTGRRCMDKQPDDDRMPCEGRKSRTWW